MDKQKILAVILGIAGVTFTLFLMVTTRVAISDINYERWETVMFTDALVFWSLSFVFGILALVFYNERKSPYLMLTSTVVATIAWIFPYLRLTLINYEPTKNVLPFIIIHSIILLCSAILLARANIWKKIPKERQM